MEIGKGFQQPRLFDLCVFYKAREKMKFGN